MARRIYDTVLDRSMSQSDVQMLAGYISAGGVLDATELANDLMASIEFNTKYGGLSDLQFIERVSQNALGRTASLIELNTLLGQVSAGTITRAGIVKLIAESTEHLVVGNIHAITNNTESGNATARDHTTDKQVAGDIVQRLYDAALNRAATAAELATESQKILSGSKAEAQVAADILALPEFTQAYGTLSNAAFVNQIFVNALGRVPTSSESSSWTSTLTSGAVTRADLLDGIAQSSEHLAIAGAVIGGSGNDTIYSRDGADTIDGGASVDVVDYSLLSIAGVNVDLATGIAVQANGSTDILANIENVNGGSGNDVLAGDGGTNILTGGSGNDTLSGNGGNDTLDGGSGTDAMTGGAGDDVYVVNDAGDAVMELPGEGVDEVRTTLAAYTLGANVEKLTFTGAGVFAGTGNALDNTLIGGTGNDTLDGGVGVDAMIGGLGDDIYLVDNASDTVTELAGEGTDEVHTTLASYALAANVERLVYTGSAAFTGTGNAIDNILTGGTGNDTLSGETAATCTCTAPARAPT